MTESEWKARYADRMAKMLGDPAGCAVAAEAAWDDCAGDVDPEEAAESEVSEWRESS